MSDEPKPLLPPGTSLTKLDFSEQRWLPTPARKADRVPAPPPAALAASEEDGLSIEADGKDHDENFALPVRDLCEEDFILGKLWEKKGKADPNLSAITFYEYARDSYVLRRWAAREAHEKVPAIDYLHTPGHKGRTVDLGTLDEIILRKLTYRDHDDINEMIMAAWGRGPYPLLWELRADLANDTPWLCIDAARRKAALKAKPFDWRFSPHLRPARKYEIQGRGLVILRRDSDGNNRSEAQRADLKRKQERDFGRTFLKGCGPDDVPAAQEVIAFKIDWENSSPADLAKALELWRPKQFPGPKPKKKQLRGRKATDRFGGVLKSNVCRAALKYLMALRLAHRRSGEWAIEDGCKLGVVRKCDYDDCIKGALDNFAETFGWLGVERPISFFRR